MYFNTERSNDKVKIIDINIILSSKLVPDTRFEVRILNVWHMLTNNEDYRYENKSLTRIKMLKLNRLAGVVNKRSASILDKGCGAKAEKEYRAKMKKTRKS